jgi:flagellar motor switch protein FliN/FliY
VSDLDNIAEEQLDPGEVQDFPEDMMPDAEPAEIPQFDELGDGVVSADPAALSQVYNLSLPIAIELGRTRMSVQEVLALGRGSVIQLDRLAGEPIDVFVGDRRFAEGEVVVVGEQFGVRITRVVNPEKSQGEVS